MKYQGVVGIGCYGKPETLSRVLKKLVEKYISGNLEEPGRKGGRPCMQFETLKLLKALIGGLSKKNQLSETKIIENIANFGIAGFSLSLKKHRLNLSVYTRHGRSLNSLNLHGLTEITNSRLH